MKKFAAILLIAVIALTSTGAFAATEIDSSSIILDTIALRPIGFASLLVGCAVYTVSLPFAAITHSMDTTYRVLVKEPFDYTFKRPVGETVLRK